jgi:hypothetical protein
MHGQTPAHKQTQAKVKHVKKVTKVTKRLARVRSLRVVVSLSRHAIEVCTARACLSGP